MDLLTQQAERTPFRMDCREMADLVVLLCSMPPARPPGNSFPYASYLDCHQESVIDLWLARSALLFSFHPTAAAA
jgi:hypothetical protein